MKYLNNKAPDCVLRRYKKIANFTRKEVNKILNINITRLIYKDIKVFEDFKDNTIFGYEMMEKSSRTIIILLENLYLLQQKKGREDAEDELIKTVLHEARHYWQKENILNIYGLNPSDENVKDLIESDAENFENQYINFIKEKLKGKRIIK